jgi:hypothetical protein
MLAPFDDGDGSQSVPAKPMAAANTKLPNAQASESAISGQGASRFGTLRGHVDLSFATLFVVGILQVFGVSAVSCSNHTLKVGELRTVAMDPKCASARRSG